MTHAHASLSPPPAAWPLYLTIAAAATALALLTTAQAGVALAFDGQQAVPWLGLLKARLVDWYACALFMPLVLALVRRYPIRRDSWPHHLPILLLASVPIAIAKEAVFVGVGEIFRPGVFHLAKILSEDLSDEVMAVWAFMAVAQLLVGPRHETLAGHAAARRAIGRARTQIEVRTARGPLQVQVADIEYVDAQGNYARLVTAGGRYLLRDTMARLESRLGAEFLRVHRSVIVRKDRVRRMEPAPNGGFWLVLESGARLRSGRSYRDAVRDMRLEGPDPFN